MEESQWKEKGTLAKLLFSLLVSLTAFTGVFMPLVHRPRWNFFSQDCAVMNK